MLYAERQGAGQKILFIHGSGCNRKTWYCQRDHLATSMEVVLVDLPGHGKTPGDGRDTIDRYSDDVYRVVQELAPEGCYLAGHSLGGAIAITLALSRPEVVRGIVLIGTGARLRVLPRILEGIMKEKERTFQDISRLSLAAGTPEQVRQEVLAMMMDCRPEVIHADFLACDRFDVIDSLGAIRVPTLVLCGEEDALTPVKYSRFLSDRIAGSRLQVIGSAGHMVHMEKPDEVDKAIDAFVATFDPSVR
jgi:pimeloyl-ACP methyl ester carboxylesterase